MTKPKLCLVEPCHSHAEVLLPQIDLLHDDYDLYVIAPQSLLDQDILSKTSHMYQGIPVRWNQWSSRLRRLFRMPGKYRDIRYIVDSLRPELVLFNSTYRAIDLILLANYFQGIRKAQIIHNFQSFLRPGMRWLYDQFDLNLVISEEVHEYIVGHHPEYRSLNYFLPIYFGSFEPSRGGVSEPLSRTDSPLQIGVFGSVNEDRRNYDGLLRSLAAWRRSHGTAHFVLHLVGRLPVEHREFIASHDLGDMVRYYDTFVPFEEMFRVLRGVDVVMFLIDSTVRHCNEYNRYKISGASTLIKAFRKACAASRDFRIDATLADKCFFYDGSRVEQFFQSIANGTITKATVRMIEARFGTVGVLSREIQKSRLLDALKRVGV